MLKTKAKTIVPIVIALAIAAGGLVYWYHSTHRPTSVSSAAPAGKVNYSPATTADNSASNQRKNSGSADQTLDNQSGSKTSSSSGSADSSNTPFTVTITSASANNGNVHVGDVVNGVASGNCTLTAIQNGQNSVVRTSTVQLDVNNYDCGVFNIPYSAFPHTGNWNMSLSVTSGGSEASNTWSQAINIPYK